MSGFEKHHGQLPNTLVRQSGVSTPTEHSEQKAMQFEFTDSTTLSIHRMVGGKVYTLAKPATIVKIGLR